MRKTPSLYSQKRRRRLLLIILCLRAQKRVRALKIVILRRFQAVVSDYFFLVLVIRAISAGK